MCVCVCVCVLWFPTNPLRVGRLGAQLGQPMEPRCLRFGKHVFGSGVWIMRLAFKLTQCTESRQNFFFGCGSGLRLHRPTSEADSEEEPARFHVHCPEFPWPLSKCPWDNGHVLLEKGHVLHPLWGGNSFECSDQGKLTP